jgi:dual oxidase
VYAVEREHVGFRQATGWGVSITRGAASAMMYSFVVILLTACRNVTSYLRDTILLRFIPFDSAFSFHQYVAWWAVFFVGKWPMFVS